ncbi:TPA: hypothetical protein MXR76_004579 [Pseudomonas aeruginosa]|uniref:hypothetical protein n=1 Tax=Pseudomonas aeruginosa TaxID=287 RepID=UPI002552FFAA|nr:hypothetical protein [Pseudomonas aeruginosa]EKF7416694.1 hypothetical protein [Pseudomonas aeruginosa]HBO1617645.1 hypothetical protein [Pseudomonas aeruginosa]HBO9385147.1 hypothetical protein [Pseudomonas aeruginosa]HCA5867063.1 hypothetical protein [Pseudomonas aeruginosa]HCA7377476.1 hypothetical protein [Pseudomonas aeruginosa]
MNMSVNQQAVDELKALFRVGHCVDIYKATAALARAITEELNPASESDINAIWQSVVEPEDFSYVVQQNGKTLFGIPLLFKRYAEFVSAIGEHLGIELDEDDMMCDDWIADSMPKTREIATALMELTVDYLSEASKKMKEETGTTPAEVFVQSINTGESFQQSQARLRHATQGLRVVKPKD